MPQDQSLGTVWAVVVTYNIGNGFDRCFQTLKGQVDHAVLVNTSTDGGATAQILHRLQQAAPAFADVLESPENNLGMAQNMGIECALAGGADWILLLDHDSLLGAGMIAALQQAYFAAEQRDAIGLLAPCLQDPDVPSQPRYLATEGGFPQQMTFDAETPVLDGLVCVSASGSLIPRRVFETGLRMDEGFVIDFIDTDFCLRLRDAGFRILAVRDAKLVHRIGERREHHFLGIKMTATHHSALRRYYQYRNRVLTWKRHLRRHPGFVGFDLARVGYELWRILLLEKDKIAKLSATTQGSWDALRGRTGGRRGASLARPGVGKAA